MRGLVDASTESFGVYVNIRSASVLLGATLLLTGCQHATSERVDADTQSASVTNPVGYYPGHTPSEIDSPAALTSKQIATDEAMARRLVGTWVSADDLRWAGYHVLVLREDFSFTVTNGGKEVSGVWRVYGGILLLTEAGAQPFDYYGVHGIDHLDDHKLVCGIAMGVAGRYTFNR